MAGTTPRKLLNGLEYALPLWMGIGDAAVAAVGLLTALAWAGFELRESSVSVAFQWPVRFR